MLVKDNKLVGQIIVIPGKVEDVTVPEEVDTIISEPMGYMLFNERMLESFLHAKKWLKPGGKLCTCRIYLFMTFKIDFPLTPFQAGNVFKFFIF